MHAKSFRVDRSQIYSLNFRSERASCWNDVDARLASAFAVLAWIRLPVSMEIYRGLPHGLQVVSLSRSYAP